MELRGRENIMKTVLTLSLVLSTALISSANIIEQWDFGANAAANAA